jgi:virulence-associated protein VagC
VDREGYTIVVFPENIYIEAKKMRVSRYGKRVILSPIKKKRAPKI